MKLNDDFSLDDYHDKHGSHWLVIEVDHSVVKTELVLTDQEAMALYEYIKQNFYTGEN